MSFPMRARPLLFASKRAKAPGLDSRWSVRWLAAAHVEMFQAQLAETQPRCRQCMACCEQRRGLD